MTTVKRALESAIEALEYHTEQTRPIQKTIDTITDIKLTLSELEKCESETSSNVVAWINEDELPATYPYDEMFKYSKVDLVRMFPVYQPQKQYQTEFAAVIYDSHAGYGATVITAGIPHGTKLFCRENQND